MVSPPLVRRRDAARARVVEADGAEAEVHVDGDGHEVVRLRGPWQVSFFMIWLWFGCFDSGSVRLLRPQLQTSTLR